MIVLIVVAFFVARGFVFTYLVWRSTRLLALMNRYWRDEVTFAEAGGRKREIQRLFRAARLTEPGVDFVDAVAPFQIVHRVGSVFENIFLDRGDVQQLVFDAFVEARGYFTDEIRRSLIPVFWPSVVADLPTDILVYLGMRPSKHNLLIARAVGAVSFVAAVLGIIAFFRR